MLVTRSFNLLVKLIPKVQVHCTLTMAYIVCFNKNYPKSLDKKTAEGSYKRIFHNS